MRKIKSFSDIEHIIKSKLDVRDSKNNVVQFVAFLRLSLIEVVEVIADGTWTYELDY